MRLVQLGHVLMIANNPHHDVFVTADAPPAATHGNQPPRGMVIEIAHLVHGCVGNKFVVDGPQMLAGTGVNPVYPQVEAVFGGDIFTGAKQPQSHRVGNHAHMAGVSVDLNNPQPNIGRSQGFAVPVVVAGYVFSCAVCGHISPVSMHLSIAVFSSQHNGNRVFDYLAHHRPTPRHKNNKFMQCHTVVTQGSCMEARWVLAFPSVIQNTIAAKGPQTSGLSDSTARGIPDERYHCGY